MHSPACQSSAISHHQHYRTAKWQTHFTEVLEACLQVPSPVAGALLKGSVRHDAGVRQHTLCAIVLYSTRCVLIVLYRLCLAAGAPGSCVLLMLADR